MYVGVVSNGCVRKSERTKGGEKTIIRRELTDVHEISGVNGDFIRFQSKTKFPFSFQAIRRYVLT